MMPVSLDCPFLIVPSVFSNVYLAYVLYDASFSGLSFFDCPFGILYRVFTQDKHTIENTEGAIKKGQSRETGIIEYTR
jgi:hypothetical protein